MVARRRRIVNCGRHLPVELAAEGLRDARLARVARAGSAREARVLTMMAVLRDWARPR
mgnify:CR=1 FL=1